MRFLKESLLSFFVVGVVLALYFIAGVAALFKFCGFVSPGNEPGAVHQLRVLTDVA